MQMGLYPTIKKFTDLFIMVESNMRFVRKFGLICLDTTGKFFSLNLNLTRGLKIPNSIPPASEAHRKNDMS